MSVYKTHKSASINPHLLVQLREQTLALIHSKIICSFKNRMEHLSLQ